MQSFVRITDMVTALGVWLCVASITQAAKVHYTLDLSWRNGAPNGVSRNMIFVNGEFPGPPLILDEGDDVTIDVNNYMPFNTSIHFHGIEQAGTPWSDGVSGLTQWGIQPGESFTYKWNANTYGTYWYHSHDMDTIQDGLYGAIHIRPSPNRQNPFAAISQNEEDQKAMKEAERNPVSVMLSDWDHMYSSDYMKALHDTGYDILYATIFIPTDNQSLTETSCTDSILIGGKGSIYCKDPEELTALQPKKVQDVVNATLTDKGCIPFTTTLQGAWEHHPEKLPDGMNSGCEPITGPQTVYAVNASNRWASFNFISAASLKAFVVSIDEHPLYVYEVDGRYIEPQLAHTIEMYNGERYSAMVKLDKEPAPYTMRIASTGANQVISGYANVTYEGGEDNERQSLPYIDYAGKNVSEAVIPLNLTTLPPFPPVKPAPRGDDFHLLTLGRINSSWQWTLDGTEFFPANLDTMEPVIFNPESPELASALKITTKNNTWVDLVYQLNIQKPTVVQPPHPMHKHSNKAFLLGKGSGRFPWSSVNVGIEQNPEMFYDQPLYRDTFVTSPQGESWMAIRYHVVNPGPFFLHCHMQTHLHGGMGVLLLDGVDAWPELPEEYQA